MNNKIILLLSLALLSIGVLVAQKKVDDKHENHFKEIPVISTDHYKIEFKDSHCQKEFIVANAIITSTTEDILLFDLGGVKFVTESGEHKNNKSKEVQVNPFETNTVTLKVDGGTDFHVENFKLIIENVSRVPITGNKQTADDFSLPPRNNNVQIGNFSCEVSKLTKKTDNMEVKFNTRYTGDKVGIVDQRRIAVKFPNGNEYANVRKASKLKKLITGNDISIYRKGDKGSFLVQSEEHKMDGDMQFIELWLVWNDAFVESEMIIIDGIEADFELDYAKTVGMN